MDILQFLSATQAAELEAISEAIDRSFIQRLGESSRSYPIVKAIIELAHLPQNASNCGRSGRRRSNAASSGAAV